MDKIDLSGKRILVTGGNGYLGRKLIKRLNQGNARVSSIDIQDFPVNNIGEFYKVDIREKDELRLIIQEIKPEIIYHLAASLERERDFSNAISVFDVNLFGTLNLLNALRDINYKKLIFTSTSEVYGGNKITPPFKENDSFVPASPYSLSKYSAEMAIKSFSALYKKKFIILRLFNFYGEGMPTQFFLSQLIVKLKNGEDFDMTMGEQIRDFSHINDVLHALLIVSGKNINNEVFNICTGEGKTIKEIALYLKEVLKSSSNINFGAIPYRENEVWRMIGDAYKIQEAFNFKNKFNIYEGLKAMIREGN